MNDFSKIDGQSEARETAQMTTEEMTEANSFFDEVQYKQDLSAGIVPDINKANWSLLDQIHNEIRPKLADLHYRRELLESVGL